MAVSGVGPAGAKIGRLVAGIVLGVGLGPVAAAQETDHGTLLLRSPDLSREHLAFVYAGDIWIANRNGSNPRRLTSHPADERWPIFSPDGSEIAFTASYDGNTDVYVIGTGGGQPRRMTWHPGDDIATDWSPNGERIYFVSRREVQFGRSAQLYRVPAGGGYAAKVMSAPVFRSAWAKDGRRLAYMAFGPAYNGLYGGTSGWRGYRGGMSPSINIMDMRANTHKVLKGNRVNDINPMWLGGDLYFISDREDKVLNIYRYDEAADSVTRLTDEKVWDVRSARAYAGTIVYEAGGRLKMLQVRSGKVTPIKVVIRPDLPQLRPQWKDASRNIESAFLSTTAKRAVLTARGEVFSVPLKDGSTRNLTRTDGVRERTALWSPKGDEIAYLSDEGNVHRLMIASQTGLGKPRSYDLGPDYYTLLAWGGKGERILYQDNHLNLYAFNVASGASSKIATSKRRGGFDLAVSPDGNWVAFTVTQANIYSDLMLYSFETGKTARLSDGMANAGLPAFSPDGKYLFFAASTNSGPALIGLDMSSQERPFRAGLYAAVLAADGKSPLLPKSGDEEPRTDDKNDGAKNSAGADAGKGSTGKPEKTRIDLNGLSGRIVALPIAEANYGALAAGADGALYYVDRVQPGASNRPPGQDPRTENALKRFDFEKKEAKTIVSNVLNFSMSADGKYLIVLQTGGKVVTGEAGEKFEAKPLDLSDVKVFVHPRNEWRQILAESWRMTRDYFYAENLHGLDWDAVYERYAPLVDHVGRREDLTDVIVEMIAELQVGHIRSGGGDMHREEGVPIGLLGADLRAENGRYRVRKIYTGEAWNPFLTAPLAAPGIGVNEGDYILSVNGEELDSGDNFYARFQGTVGKQVTLTVNGKPSPEGARDVVVEPIGDDFMLRRWEWIESNRRYVERKTKGRVGYVYLPNTAGDGYDYFNRMFFAQADRDAMIIDERTNGGGQAANYITDVLGRTYLAGWKDRDGLVFSTPGSGVYGPKVMLIDQGAGSGGDFLPYSFRHMKLGKLIGKRTWGGLIGIFANPLLIDGGFVSVPFFRFFTPEGEWTIENEGVAPDIDVALDPLKFNKGTDTQLDRAIREVTDQLKTFKPIERKEAPPLPTPLRGKERESASR